MFSTAEQIAIARALFASGCEIVVLSVWPVRRRSNFQRSSCQSPEGMLTGGWVDTVSDMVFALESHHIVMIYGDMNPWSIIVQGSKFVSFFDSEVSGYYPEYWEYAKALYRPAWESKWIETRAVGSILDFYSIELAVVLGENSIGGW